MPDKPTDSEIKKALEDWIKELKDDYKRLQLLDAPMDCFEESHIDNIRMLSNSLDLINRLQVEKENYRQVAEHQQSVTLDRGFEIKKLKAEIERLKQNLEEAEDTIQFADKEIKKLNAENEKLCQINGTLLNSGSKLFKEIETAKAEAYKEFAERLKTKLSIADDNFNPIVTEEEIDNLLKEMECDANG